MQEKRFQIRPLHALDAAPFRQIRLQAIAEAPSAVWPTHAEEAERTVEEIQHRILKTDTQIVFGVFIDDALVGIAGLRREALAQVRHKAVLWGVFINAEYRRAGLARTLFAAVQSHARSEGVLQIQLCVNVDNLKARNLYGSLGFTSFGIEARAMRVGDSYFDEEHMALRLDR